MSSRLSIPLDNEKWGEDSAPEVWWLKRLKRDQTVTSMGYRQVLVGADRDDTGWVDVVVRDAVVAFDVVDIHGLGNAVGLVEIFQIPEQVWVVDDSSEIAFEMAVVHGVEPNQCDKKPPVGFHKLRSE